MILDIGFIVLLVIFIILGYRRGFSLEFFNMFKYIFIIFITNHIYKFFLNSNRINPRNQLKIFIIMVVIQCIVYSAILIINGKFLQSIKMKKFDKFYGMMFGIMKIFFVAIIVYIIIITGSGYSRRIRELRDKSFSIQFMTKHALKFADSFPNFIKNDVEGYVISKREKQVINDVLSNYENFKMDEFEKNKIIN
ncbi:colicin V production protein [Leptotrichia trevisanii]|uniref:Colicin V production protein n=1 Tax=Leptotrichia trevisanii TaxID=109328 RepID=A0A510K2Q8_9FUSO|nr:CvpA family protein [Leptotrichia trevisanii]BBM45958.1 colicin V production protein [Leptotrichia trevisanii]BBM53170.1 colicin V production protein [Leptotrichia trevisanii]BBM57956.1 colicin V production protein [Leptotrichia trevisanii]